MITSLSPSFTRVAVFFDWNTTSSFYLEIIQINMIKLLFLFFLIDGNVRCCCGGFNSRMFYTQIFWLFLVVIAKQVVATFHLHCLGHGIKYENVEVKNTTQQFLSTPHPCWSIEFIESIFFESFSSHITLNVPRICESCIEIKIKLSFIFALLCGASKGFMKAFKPFIKPFRSTTKKCENKNLT